jgi:preprotein translocase subunit YajC
MEQTWIIVTLVVIAAVGFIFFLIKRNQKDKKDLEKQLNEDYEKLRDSGPHI